MLESARADPAKKVWVGNLPKDASALDLEAHFQLLGTPSLAEILRPGTGCVVYETAEEVAEAIENFNGSEFDGKNIRVDVWTGAKKNASPVAPGFKGKGGGSVGKAMAAPRWGSPGIEGADQGDGEAKGAKWGPSTSAAPRWGWGSAKGGGFGPGPYSRLAGAGGNVYGGKAYGPSGAGSSFYSGASHPYSRKTGYGSPPTTAQNKQSWGAGAASQPPQVLWLALNDSTLVMEGYTNEGPAIAHRKGDELISSGSYILGEIVEDIAEQVTIIHDPDWEQFPEIGEAVKEASGEEHCIAVAMCPERAKWAVGLAGGWKPRETVVKLSLSVALAMEDPSVLKRLRKQYPDFVALCEEMMNGRAQAAPPAEEGEEELEEDGAGL